VNDLLEVEFRATKLVHWPSGPTYACDYHAEALQKIASAMKLHIAVENYILDDKICTNCLNESSIAKEDLDE
jgi:hypothetical protein